MNPCYKVTIAHAVTSENGTRYGQPGNQTYNMYNTTGELRFSDWYMSGNKPWTVVLRAKKRSQRIAIASAAVAAVKNHKIGYDQHTRETLYDAVQYKRFDPDQVEYPVNCDCSSLVTVCCNYAGIPILRGTYTGNLYNRADAVGMFRIYKTTKHRSSQDALEVGDILLRVGHHTVIVVNTMFHMCNELKLGSVGNDVKALQVALNEWIAADLVIDGEFGFKTDDALRRYQITRHLKNDGIMGELTSTSMGFLWR